MDRPVTLHEDFTKRITKVVTTLPFLPNGGKVSVTFELSCGSGGVFKEMDVELFIAEKVRV